VNAVAVTDGWKRAETSVEGERRVHIWLNIAAEIESDKIKILDTGRL